MSQIDVSEGLVGNTAFKSACRAGSTVNIPTMNGLLTIDGVLLAAGDRVLVKDQLDATKNGIWSVDSGDWSRTDDADGAYDFATGTTVLVMEGTTNARTYWQLTTTGTIIVGTTSLVWSEALFGDSGLLTFIQGGTGTVARSAQDKMRDIIATPDYTSIANAWGNVTTRGGIIVPRGAVVTPAGATGKDVTYLFIDGGDSDNVLLFDGTRGGLYSDYDCKAGTIIISHFDASQSAVAGGGFRDGLFVNARTNDATDYTAIGNKVVHAGRFFTQGPHNGTNYTAVYQDLVGAYFSAAGNVQWSARGASAITADAWQFGIGIISNEFAINNPAAGAGGQGQSVSAGAVQAIVRMDYADEDGTHFAYGVIVGSSGKRITSAIMIYSDTSRGFDGHYKHLLYAADAKVSGSAIIMPQSVSGDVGTIIAYDTNDYSLFDRTNNRFNWINGGNLVLSVTPNGLAIGSATTTGTWLFIEASTTAKSHIRMFQGVAPSSPADGDFWYNGTNLKFQNGATLRTINWT